MKITFGSVVLCAGANRAAGPVGPSGFVFNGQRITQPKQFIRAVEGGAFDRGNVTTTVSFTTHMQHASVAAAEAYMLDHATSLPGSGILKILADQGGAARYLLDAVLTAYTHSYNGVRTSHQYTIVGGAFGTSPTE